MCKLSLDLVIAHTAKPKHCANTQYLLHDVLLLPNNDPYNIKIRIVGDGLGTQEIGGISEGSRKDLYESGWI